MGRIQLQQPEFAYVKGAVRPWSEAVLHVSSEAVLRSANVYEGIKGYWQPDGSFAIVELERHFERLCQSARILRLPMPVDLDGYEKAVRDLVDALVEPGRDMWVRTNVFAVEGHWGLDTETDLIMTAFHQEQVDPEDIDIGVSTWIRPPDLAMPPRIKTTGNYQVGRLARIEGREMGYDEMILMNIHGRISEATGANLLISDGNSIVSPPATEGVLEGITLQVVAKICRDLGIPFERRPVDRSELLIADELAVCGTLAEVAQARSIERLTLPRTREKIAEVAAAYLAAVRGTSPSSAAQMNPLAGIEEAERRAASA
jgi:branched-chain amino acid aminotransferase